MISPVYTSPHITVRNFHKNSPSFARRVDNQFAKVGVEKTLRSVEMFGRKFVNSLSYVINKKKIDRVHADLVPIETSSPAYIRAVADAGRFFAKGKEVEINLESRRLEKLAKSDSASIFIINHDNQSQDPNMLAFFNTLLNDAYKRWGKAADCPRPKIILNEDILLSMSKKTREIFEKLGAIGVDASVINPDGNKNARALVPLIKDFINDKVNIFIFPEGKLAGMKNLLIEDRFQNGIADILKTILPKKKSVNVTPLGFSYNTKSKSKLSSIYIGENIKFVQDGKKVLVSKGNMDSKHTDEVYKRFFANGNEELKTITEKGVPVEGKENRDYIAGILCENLRICKAEAEDILPKKSLGDKVIKL